MKNSAVSGAMTSSRSTLRRRAPWLVLALSVLLLAGLEWVTRRRLVLPAVGVGDEAHLLAHRTGHVSEVFVRDGDWVSQGQRLALLRAERPPAQEPGAESGAAPGTDSEVVAPSAGVVTGLVTPGQPLSPGLTIARVVSSAAVDAVAYLPATENASRVLEGVARARVSEGDGRSCAARLVHAEGAPVAALPEQLALVAGFAHGVPVRFHLAEGCEMGVGQILRVEVER